MSKLPHSAGRWYKAELQFLPLQTGGAGAGRAGLGHTWGYTGRAALPPPHRGIKTKQTTATTSIWPVSPLTSPHISHTALVMPTTKLSSPLLRSYHGRNDKTCLNSCIKTLQPPCSMQSITGGPYTLLYRHYRLQVSVRVWAVAAGCYVVMAAQHPLAEGGTGTSTSHNRSSLHIVQQTAAASPTSTCPTSVHQTQGLKTEKKYFLSCLLHVLMYECTIYAMCNNSMICPSFVFSHPNSEM